MRLGVSTNIEMALSGVPSGLLATRNLSLDRVRGSNRSELSRHLTINAAVTGKVDF
jgi:hypothetical protein